MLLSPLLKFKVSEPWFRFQERAYFASDRLTWVDFAVFDLIENNLEFAAYNFGQESKSKVDILEMFPKLNNFYRHLRGHPKLARWVFVVSGHRASCKKVRCRPSSLPGRNLSILFADIWWVPDVQLTRFQSCHWILHWPKIHNTKWMSFDCCVTVILHMKLEKWTFIRLFVYLWKSNWQELLSRLTSVHFVLDSNHLPWMELHAWHSFWQKYPASRCFLFGIIEIKDGTFYDLLLSMCFNFQFLWHV